MKKMIQAGATVLTLICAVNLFARENVDQEIAAPMDSSVRINVVRGEVRVVAWDKPAIRVFGELDEEMEEFIFRVNGDQARIEVKVPRNKGWRNKDESELTIRVPLRSSISVSGVSTDVDIKGAGGAVEVGVVSGDVLLVGGAERIVLQTVSGEVELRGGKGRIRVKTVSGDIESFDTHGHSRYGSVSGGILVENGGEEIELESVSGDIEVERTAMRRLQGHSVSGDVEIAGSLAKDGTIEFDNVSGSLRLELDGDINARFDLETGSGSIRNRITSDTPKVSKYVRDETLRFETGSGSAEVILSTRSGDITLSR